MSNILTNTTELQEVLEILQTKAAGVSLPELTNEGTASDLLFGKQLINQDGQIITGNIATKDATNVSVSGASVTVPAGYYASSVSKSVATVPRAKTTISVTADDTNDKLTITAINNQETGYVTGINETEIKTISLTASGATVTASDGTKSISKSVSTATQATPSISIDAAGKITASATQTAGYVTAGTKSSTKQLTTKTATTYTPGTSDQTIGASTYLTGVQTIKGDANLIADNIKNGVKIFNVTGTLSTSGSQLDVFEQDDWAEVKTFTIEEANKYIEGSTGIYNYCEGMTWQEWVESEFNTEEYYISESGQIKTSRMKAEYRDYVVYYWGEIYASEFINSDVTYWFDEEGW